MPDTESILSFNMVTTALDPWFDLPIVDVTLDLTPGDLALVRFDHHSPNSPLPDAAMGLADLIAGEVQFMGRSWPSRFPRRASRDRGRIGRFFGMHGWIHHLDVDENITLRLRHHTRRSAAAIDREALELAEVFGLKELPNVRPVRVDAHDLQRCACVRMLLGFPPLIIIDEPPGGLYHDVLQPLKRELTDARARGAAVLWLTADPAIWTDDRLRPTFRGDAAAPGLALSATVTALTPINSPGGATVAAAPSE